MDYRNTLDKFCFRCTASIYQAQAVLRTRLLCARGAKIGAGTLLPRLSVTWPHQLRIGDNCTIEEGTWFRHDGWNQPGACIQLGSRVFLGRGCLFLIKSSIRIGDDCNIAAGCKFVDFDHCIDDLDRPISLQACRSEPISLEKDVWLGANVVVLRGVVIGSGAVIGAGAVVTKSVPANEVWAGVPARKIGERGGVFVRLSAR